MQWLAYRHAWHCCMKRLSSCCSVVHLKGYKRQGSCSNAQTDGSPSDCDEPELEIDISVAANWSRYSWQALQSCRWMPHLHCWRYSIYNIYNMMSSTARCKFPKRKLLCVTAQGEQLLTLWMQTWTLAYKAAQHSRCKPEPEPMAVTTKNSKASSPSLRN